MRVLNGRAAKTQTGAGAGCLILFALPFAAVGVGTAVGSLRAALADDWGQCGFFAIFALTFGGAGFGLIAGALYARGRLRDESCRKAAHPDEPWRWNRNWDGGRIRCGGKGGMIGACVFAAFWNLVSVPAMMFIPREVLEKQNYPALIGLVFPLVGLILLVWAVRSILHWRKYGASIFEMAEVPGVIGGRLGGIIHTNVNLRAADGFRVTLTCINKVVTGSGKHSSTHEHVRWQEERTVTRDLLTEDPTRSAIPVLFTIPYDCQQTDDKDSRNEILWRLEAKADVPGLDFDAQFQVPVFRTPASAADVTAADGAHDASFITADREPETLSRILVTPLPGGGTEIYYPAARNPGVAAGTTAFTIGWLGVVVFLSVSDAPLIFPILFGGFGVLMVLGTLWLLFGVTRVRLDYEGLVVRTSVLGFGKTRRAPLDAIRRFTTRVGMQAGRTPYYQIHAVLAEEQTITAGDGMREKRDAERLATVLTRAVEALA